MKLRHHILLIGIVLGSLGLGGCLKDSCSRTVTYTRVAPIYENMDAIRNTPIVLGLPKPIQLPGKLECYGNQMFINEKGVGIHLIDNTDPANPNKTGFIEIPGNYNFIVNNGFLYANSYVDLLVFELSDLSPSSMPDQTDLMPISRLENVFNAFWKDNASGNVAFNFESNRITQVVDCATDAEFLANNDGQLVAFVDSDDFVGSRYAVANSLDSTALIGAKAELLSETSIAQFTILGEKLYSIHGENLVVFDLTNPSQPTAIASHYVGFDNFRLANYGEKLAVSGYSITNVFDVTNGLTPITDPLGYATACDPFAYKGQLVFISKNTGKPCFSERNELVVTGTPVNSPSFIGGFYPIDDPQGIAVNDDYLFLCDGANGLKIFDISQEELLSDNLVANAKNVHAYDVKIVGGAANLVVVLGADGVYQYSFSSAANGDPALLSKISFE